MRKPLTLAAKLGLIGTALLLRSVLPRQAGAPAVSLAALGRALIDPVLLPAYLVALGHDAIGVGALGTARAAGACCTTSAPRMACRTASAAS